MENAGEFLLALGSSPAAIAIAIVLATFVLEDAATVGAALLAASGLVAAPLALAALFIGIFAGDLGLYGLGAAARTQPWARNWVGDERIEQGRNWLKHRLARALIGARFLPGFRLPVFAASGFLRVPFGSFAAITAAAGGAWTALVFTLVFAFGSMILNDLGPWKWAVGGLTILLMFVGPPLARALSTRPRG
jgi:membrane protein DedA with SNARE-associated domain